MAELKEQWFQFADQLYKAGKMIFDNSQATESEAGTRDPKVVALALLARTMGNFQAGFQLLDDGYVVEARILTRCCYENLFWIAALVRSGDEFVRAMELDDAASRIKRANGLLDWSERQNQKLDFAEGLEALIADLKGKPGKAEGIGHKRAADQGGVGDAYIIYRELSGDAAHPSATSLSRHVTWSNDGESEAFTVHALPVRDAHAVEDTLELACSALLGVCIAANEILNGVERGECLKTLSETFKELSSASKAERDRIL